MDLWTSDSSSPANRLQALTSTNDSYKYLNPTIDGDVETDAIKFVHTNKEKLTMFSKENPKESKEPDYDGDKNSLTKIKKRRQESSMKRQITMFSICKTIFYLVHNKI